MTSNRVILGLQWGDEGKGKVIDLLAEEVDYVVRCQGGANAGHTVVVNSQKTILHLLPSGALHPKPHCVIGNGVVVDPSALLHELAELGDAGEALKQRLHVSDRAHLVLPCHKRLDAALEAYKGDGKVGTTLRGIGPCYADKVSRVGVRCGDLLQPDLRDRLRDVVERASRLVQELGQSAIDIDAMLDEILPACEAIAPYVDDTVARLHDAHTAGKRMLFEGAQGIMLDIDHGTYPFVTSSNTGLGGVITGSGLSHRAMGEVIGILKAYTTRVGSGPFTVEQTNERGQGLRDRGAEYGATTGRPRRCGWLDLVIAKYACLLNGVDTIALTKLDVLSAEPEIPVCMGYELDGRTLTSVPAHPADLARATPVYEHLAGWQTDISTCRNFDDLPTQARDYVTAIERYTGVRVGYIGTGPDRQETIIR